MLDKDRVADILLNMDFELIVNEDGTLSLHDLQHANLGGIETETFENYAQVLSRMDMYTRDYFVTPLVECLNEDYGDSFNSIWNEEDNTWEELVRVARDLGATYGEIDYLDDIIKGGLED